MSNGNQLQPPPLLEVSGLEKVYRMVDSDLKVLRGVNLSILQGEMVALVGKSGVGKSTLLHILGTLDNPSAGSVRYNGSNIFELEDEELAQFRNENVGFIFQFHHLLPEFTALENVMMPKMIHGDSPAEAETAAIELLERVGLQHRMQHRPAELSGGEQQRVAIARSLVMRPKLVLADEPTGNLDTDTSESIHELLQELNEETEISFLIATHSPELANRMERILELTHGDVVERPGRNEA